MTSKITAKGDSTVLLDILLLMTGTVGTGLKSKKIAQVLKVDHAQVRRVFRALVDKEWCHYDATHDAYYTTVTFWVICHIANNTFVRTVDTLSEDVLTLMGLAGDPDFEAHLECGMPPVTGTLQ